MRCSYVRKLVLAKVKVYIFRCVTYCTRGFQSKEEKPQGAEFSSPIHEIEKTFPRGFFENRAEKGGKIRGGKMPPHSPSDRKCKTAEEKSRDIFRDVLKKGWGLLRGWRLGLCFLGGKKSRRKAIYGLGGTHRRLGPAVLGRFF